MSLTSIDSKISVLLNNKSFIVERRILSGAGVTVFEDIAA